MSITDFLDIPEEVPKWKRDAATMGIETNYIFDMADSYWEASVEWFGEIQTEAGETEREAVNSLLFKINHSK